MESAPKPNTQALSWFYGEFKKGTLGLKPRFQRNPIWSDGQKCFLIDSLISGCPIPQVFINIIIKKTGKGRETHYEVVDGQQRLRAILEYMDDEYDLISTTAKSYPVSNEYKPHIGKKFSQLPQTLQDTIWNYQLSVQELRGWNDPGIRALFRRLNYVVERLNKQEMRHSQYFGEFVDAVEKLSKISFWDDNSFFSRRDSQRMRDVEFISELFVLIIDGPQDQQKTLDSFYAKYDVEFPKRKLYMDHFRNILGSINTISHFLRKSRYNKKADFYGLFGAVANLTNDGKDSLDLTPAINELKTLQRELEKEPSTLTGKSAEYYATVIEGPNKLTKRKKRINILSEIIQNSCI